MGLENVHMFFPLWTHLITLGVEGENKVRKIWNINSFLSGFKKDTEKILLNTKNSTANKETLLNPEYYIMVSWKRHKTKEAKNKGEKRTRSVYSKWHAQKERNSFYCIFVVMWGESMESQIWPVDC